MHDLSVSHFQTSCSITADALCKQLSYNIFGSFMRLLFQSKTNALDSTNRPAWQHFAAASTFE
jgi:hypothetical protein